MAGLTNDNAIETLLRTINKRIVVGEMQPDAERNENDISRADVHAIQMSTESTIVGRFSRFYAQPMSLRADSTRTLVNEIATKLTCYNIWSAMQPTATIEDLPAAVRNWKVEADALLEQIVPTGKQSPMAGRDIILEGETLKGDAGDIAQPIFGASRCLPYGGQSI